MRAIINGKDMGLFAGFESCNMLLIGYRVGFGWQVIGQTGRDTIEIIQVN